MLKTEKLTYSYSGTDLLSFRDVELQREEHLLVLGRSGAGKSTFLHLLAGLIKPSSGRIMVNGEEISKMGAAQTDRFRGRNMGLVFQNPHFLKSLTVEENLVVAQQLGSGKSNRKKIISTLTGLGLGSYGNRRPMQLSSGEQQRLSIVRAVINEPTLILADEPTSALDDENAAKVAVLLKEAAAQHKAALVVVTHDKRLKDIFSNSINL